MSASRVQSLRVGVVRTLPQPEWARTTARTWRSAYRKDEVEGPCALGPLGFAGDEVHATHVHGGVHMAVLAYSAEHYPAWQRELGRDDFGSGALGENLTLTGLEERTVCIGDVFAIGTAEVEVSQPRGPCANISRYWGIEDLLARVTVTGRTGWYLRVRTPGVVTRGDEVRRVAQPWPALTVARALAAREDVAADVAGARALAECAALSPEWRDLLTTKLARLG